MKKVRFFANILTVLAVAAQLTACLSNEDPYNAGFRFSKPTDVRTFIYANTATDSLVMECYGEWKISADAPDASWCSIDMMKGHGDATYSLGVHFAQNTTNQARLAQFTITDTNHPNDAYATWQYLQYATRGDGSFGSAALVKGITSSDGWNVAVSYDDKCRPVKLSVKNPEGNTDNYTMSYNEATSLITVNMGNSSLTGSMDNGYQTERLVGVGDTIGYVPQYYPNGMKVSPNYAFNYVVSHLKRSQGYAYLLSGKSLEPDSLHNADSLVYYSRWKLVNRPTTVERYKLEYSQMDNRYQTVDVNQLLLGMADCDPLQLIAMFRYCRSTSIVKRATSTDGNILVTTELNSDKSVRRMVVADGVKGTEVTYDFAY